MKIATYNIHHCADGIDNVASVIRDMNADIVGLQEADSCNGRSNGLDQPALLAERTGMKYYRFARSIDFRGGGYGNVILSRYPIISYETIPLESLKYEKRSVGHAVIDVNGTLIDHFNTHLSYEAKEPRDIQFKAIAQMLKKAGRYYILTGDFNTDDMREFEVLCANIAINREDRRFISFPGYHSAIDNILLSGGFSEVSAEMITRSYSDHYALSAVVEIKK